MRAGVGTKPRNKMEKGDKTLIVDFQADPGEEIFPRGFWHPERNLTSPSST